MQNNSAKKKYGVITLFAGLLIFAGCASEQNDGPPRYSIDVSKIKNAKPRREYRSRSANPKSYVVLGKRYYVRKKVAGYNKRGIASWYGTKFHGKKTSNGETYDMLAMTAASKVLPIPCFARVTNLENNKTIVVRVNDRGPFVPNRIIDLSYAAAKKLDMTKKGTALVQVTTIVPGDHESTGVHFAHHPKLYLQIGAFHDENNAERLKRKLESVTNSEIEIVHNQRYFNRMYRVRIGPLKGVGESDKLKSSLENRGFGEALTVIG